MRELKYLRLFEDFRTSDLTSDLINEKITLTEYLDYIDNSLNESLLSGISEFFSSFKTKVLDGLFTFLKKSVRLGFKVFDSVFSLIKLAIKQISKFEKKYPILYRILIITLIILFLMIISASSACAQSAGKPIDPEKINMAIGWFKPGGNIFLFAEGKEEGWKILNQSLVYLTDLRDGKIDGQYTKRVIEVANGAIQTVTDLSEEAKRASSTLYKGENTAEMCKRLLQDGIDFLSNPKYWAGGIGLDGGNTELPKLPAVPMQPGIG